MLVSWVAIETLCRTYQFLLSVNSALAELMIISIGCFIDLLHVQANINISSLERSRELDADGMTWLVTSCRFLFPLRSRHILFNALTIIIEIRALNDRISLLDITCKQLTAELTRQHTSTACTQVWMLLCAALIKQHRPTLFTYTMGVPRSNWRDFGWIESVRYRRWFDVSDEIAGIAVALFANIGL